MSGADPKKSASHKPPPSHGRASNTHAGGIAAPVTGALHDALARERAQRLSTGGSGVAGARMNRLGGLLVLPPPAISLGKTGEHSEGQEKTEKKGVAQLVRDPRLLLDEGAFSRPHANKKRSKANFTFVQVITSSSTSPSIIYLCLCVLVLGHFGKCDARGQAVIC